MARVRRIGPTSRCRNQHLSIQIVILRNKTVTIVLSVKIHRLHYKSIRFSVKLIRFSVKSIVFVLITHRSGSLPISSCPSVEIPNTKTELKTSFSQQQKGGKMTREK